MAHNELSGRQITWYDENTLIFAGAPDDGSTLGFPASRAHIYIWRLGQKPRPYRAEDWPPNRAHLLSSVGLLCAADGAITYATAAAKIDRGEGESPIVTTTQVATGPIGHEHPALFVQRTLKVGNGQPTPNALENNCAAPFDPNMSFHIWSLTPDGRYRLDFGVPSANNLSLDGTYTQRLIQLQANQRPSRPLTMAATFTDLKRAISKRLLLPAGDIDIGCVHSVSWSDEFITWPCSYDSRGDGHEDQDIFPIWRIAPDREPARSTVDLSSIQSGLGAVKYITAVIPTPNGLYLNIHVEGRTRQLSLKSGIYHATSGGLTQVATGTFFFGSLSPSGCRISLTRLQYVSAQASGRMLVMDVCGSRER